MPRPSGSSARTIRRLEKQRGALHSYKYMLGQYSRNEKIDIGPPVPASDKKRAWSYLPLATRKILDQKREGGEYGGIAGQAPYWNIQERGLPEVGIKAIEYLANAVRQWRQTLGNEVSQWIGSYGFGEQAHLK